MKDLIEILYLEDNPGDIALVREQLESDGFLCDIAVAPDRRAFELALEQGHWDLILCDYSLPNYDGISALKLAQQKHPGVPVIILSGALGPEEAVECLREGATDYLLKDRPERLASAIHRALSQKEEREARRKAEQERLESEERFRLLAEHSSDVFWFVALHPTHTLYISPAIEKLWRFPREQFYQNPRSWLEVIHQDDRVRATAAYKAWVSGTAARYKQEYRILCPDGSTHWVLDEGTKICDASGLTIRLSGIARDITDRVEAEQQIRQALATLDATEDAVFIFDPESLRFDYVNEGAMRQLGYAREELLNMQCLHIKPPSCVPRCQDILAKMLRGEVRTHRLTTLHRHKQGHDFPVEINLQYVSSVGDRPRCIAIARDITERLRNERLAQRSQRLEAIGTLASGVAHDLNNALAPILMGLELLRMEYPRASGTVDIFQSSTKRAAEMVRQLLTFAKGAEGERVAIQPAHLVKEMQKIMKGTLPKNIALEVNFEPDLPAVLGDATQLHQVLLNLCVNARDAMPNGGTLAIECECVEIDRTYASAIPDGKAGTFVVFRVRDTGTGISPEILDRIFDPFFTTKGPDKGTGLGLSTTLGIVKGHGGFLQVYSQPDRGSIFSAYLPVDRATSQVQPTSNAQPQFRGNGQTILLVDDEAPVREVGRAVLGRLNFKVITATDGADALIHLAEHRKEISAVITDLHMPYMDGVAFVSAVRRILPDVAIIIASGRMEDKEEREFKELGVEVHLDKPFTEAQLARVLQTVFSPK